VCAGAALGPGLPGPPIAALLATGIALAARRRHRFASIAALTFVGFSCGALAAHARTGVTAIEELARDVPRCAISGRILEEAGGLGTLVTVVEARCVGRAPVTDPGVVVLDGAVGFSGDRVEASGWLLPLGNEPFGVARSRAGAGAAMDPNEIELSPVSGGPLAIASAIRTGLDGAMVPLSEEEAALVRGLTIGDTERIDGSTIELFRRSGLSHLLAVSGSNVAIVLGAVMVLARRVRLWIRTAGGAIALALFVVVVGPDPSVLRAAVMGGLALAAVSGGSRSDPLHALAIAMIVVVGARPGLVFSVGLHLSAAATFGIVVWGAPFARRLAFLPRPLALLLAATVTAQVAVAPILIATFGRISVAGPVANVLAVPAVAPATIAGLAGAVVAAFVPHAGATIARIAGPFAGWILYVGRSLGEASWASIALPRSLGWVVGVPLAAVAVRSVIRAGGSG
jgi:ComEC/Rec2-related protein